MSPRCGAIPPEFRHAPWPEGHRVVSLEEAARAAGTKLRAMYHHAAKGHIWAWRSFSGHGPWRVVLDAEGLPADPPGRPSRRVTLPDGWRHVSLKEAAGAAEKNPRTMYRHAAKGHVWAWRLFSGHGPWRVVLDVEGFPADPPSESGQ